MAELKQCEFFLLRYVPDAVKDEFVNIGVVLRSENGAAEFRMTHDWSRVRCMDPTADLEMLEAVEAELRAHLGAGGESTATILKKLDDSFSNLLQVSLTKGCVTADPAAEIESLAKLYLESSRREKLSRDAGARARIVRRMRDAFEKAEVWERMWKKIPLSDLTETGDPLRIDCGYRPNGVVRLFHALSLETDVNSSKVLAYSYPALQAGILRKENATTELTAIVENGLDRADEQVAFAMGTLDKSSIKISAVEELSAIAERARIEMKI